MNIDNLNLLKPFEMGKALTHLFNLLMYLINFGLNYQFKKN